MFSARQLLIPSTNIYYIRHVIFIDFNYTIRLPQVFLKQNKTPRIVTPVLLYLFYKKSTFSFPQAKQNPKNNTTSSLKTKIPTGFPRKKKVIYKVTTRITYTTWSISEFKSIYVMDKVDNVIQMIESRIGFIYFTTDLYDSQLCSKDDEDYSLHCVNCIRKLVQMNNPLCLGVGLNHTVLHY